MANKYFTYEEDSDYYNDTGDVASGVEPAVYTVSEFNTYFKGETNLQHGDYNENCKQVVGFKTPNNTNGVYQFVKQGYMPTMNSCFASITSAGTYAISRSSSGIKIGSTTYGPSSFRNNFVPWEIFVVIVGGGGGGGGAGYTEVEKDVFEKVIGGGGGGGAVVGYRLSFGSNITPKSIVVGAGGAAGSNHASDSAGSGTAGGAGGASKIIVNVPAVYTNPGDQAYAQANGGGLGGGGRGDEDGGKTYGAGGSGGTGSFTGTGCKRSGGSGNTNSNMSRCDVSDLNFTITKGTGAPESNVASAHYTSGSPYNSANSFLSGGCSYGSGAHQRGATAGIQKGTGGGGGAGLTLCAGAAGAAYFYY